MPLRSVVWRTRSTPIVALWASPSTVRRPSIRWPSSPICRRTWRWERALLSSSIGMWTGWHRKDIQMPPDLHYTGKTTTRLSLYIWAINKIIQFKYCVLLYDSFHTAIKHIIFVSKSTWSVWKSLLTLIKPRPQATVLYSCFYCRTALELGIQFERHMLCWRKFIKFTKATHQTT